MESNRSLLKLLVFKIFILFSVPAFSQSFYVSGSIGQNYQDDTSNNGTFTSAFTTGAVTGATPPLTIPAGSAVSWNTDYNNGDAINFAVGMTRDNYRFELEYSQTQADVDSHRVLPRQALIFQLLMPAYSFQVMLATLVYQRRFW